MFISQCHRGTALDGFFQQILGDTNITKIAWLGSGCSPATEPTAEISHYYNVVQVWIWMSDCGVLLALPYGAREFRVVFPLSAHTSVFRLTCLL